MTQLEIDRLSHRELTELTTKLCRRVLSLPQLAMPLAIPGDNQQPIGFLVSAPPPDQDDIDPEFLEELRRRIANPPDHYLTVDEFFAALDAEPSPVPATGK
jgi:hypothetical protein